MGKHKKKQNPTNEIPEDNLKHKGNSPETPESSEEGKLEEKEMQKKSLPESKQERGSVPAGESGFGSQLKIVQRVLRISGWVSLMVFIVMYLSTSIAQVKVQETGVLMRFGKVVRPHVGPGICLKYPWPVDKLVTVKTRSVERMRVGFSADVKAIPSPLLKQLADAGVSLDQYTYGPLWVAYALTGDKNILHIKVVVTYKIKEPVAYLHNIKSSEDILKLLAQNSILNNIGQRDVDDVLTTRKLELQKQVFQDLVDLSNTIGMGLDILSVEIKNVRPPRLTLAAFKDVIDAQEEKNEAIHKAEAYRNQVIPEARGQAEKLVQKAEAYKNKKKDHSKGEAKRFELLAAEYRKNPEVTRERLRLETLEQILPNIEKYITESPENRDLVHLRIYK